MHSTPSPLITSYTIRPSNKVPWNFSGFITYAKQYTKGVAGSKLMQRPIRWYVTALFTILSFNKFSWLLHMPPYVTIHKSVSKHQNVAVAIWTHGFRLLSLEHPTNITFKMLKWANNWVKGDSPPWLSQHAQSTRTFPNLTPCKRNNSQLIHIPNPLTDSSTKEGWKK